MKPKNNTLYMIHCTVYTLLSTVYSVPKNDTLCTVGLWRKICIPSEKADGKCLIFHKTRKKKENEKKIRNWEKRGEL